MRTRTLFLLLMLVCAGSGLTAAGDSFAPIERAVTLATTTVNTGITNAIIGTNVLGSAVSTTYYVAARPASASGGTLFIDFVPSRNGTAFCESLFAENRDPFLTLPLKFTATTNHVEGRIEVPARGVHSFRIQVRNGSGQNAQQIRVYRVESARD